MTDLSDESRPREEGEQGLLDRLRGLLGGRNDTGDASGHDRRAYRA